MRDVDCAHIWWEDMSVVLYGRVQVHQSTKGAFGADVIPTNHADHADRTQGSQRLMEMPWEVSFVGFDNNQEARRKWTKGTAKGGNTTARLNTVRAPLHGWAKTKSSTLPSHNTPHI
mmetsp:Transcript_19429/g.54040  ORF Transcript_19429/g.54040 Transcript_19429/m.54040 type:complete len:117 (+) Transcript_19429:849-1199(+)